MNTPVSSLSSVPSVHLGKRRGRKSSGGPGKPVGTGPTPHGSYVGVVLEGDGGGRAPASGRKDVETEWGETGKYGGRDWGFTDPTLERRCGPSTQP